MEFVHRGRSSLASVALIAVASNVAARSPSRLSTVVSNEQAIIGDFVWEDLDGNGQQDVYESGMENVRVELYDSGARLIASTSTDADGLYSFAVAGGTYYLKFIAPSGYGPTKQDTGADDAIDSDADTLTGQTATVTLAASATDLSWDAGLYRPTAIGGTVWLDSDNDGYYEPLAGELPIGGAAVRLLECNDNILESMASDADGRYSFGNLAPGCYTVDVDGTTLPRSFTTSLASEPISVLLASGESYFNADFGYRPYRVIGAGSPSYWRSHPSVWPTEFITVGGFTYTKEQARVLLQLPEVGDKSRTLFRDVVAAKLNVGIGNDYECVADALLSADGWLQEHPAGSAVPAWSDAWADAVFWHLRLDAYNEGFLCAPRRD